MSSRQFAVAAVVLVSAALLGGGMQVAEPILGLPNSVSALGAPWLVAAFAVGMLVRRRAMAAGAGAVLLTTGTALYYATLVYGYGNSAMSYATAMALAWGIAACLAGATMGALGSLWRDAGGTQAVILAALPAAALAGEAVLLRTTWHGGDLALALELVLAGGILALLSRRRAPLPAAVLTAVILALVFAGVEGGVRDVMRAAGWHGA
jgi:uncharacterized protein DUF6518